MAIKHTLAALAAILASEVAAPTVNTVIDATKSEPVIENSANMTELDKFEYCLDHVTKDFFTYDGKVWRAPNDDAIRLVRGEIDTGKDFPPAGVGCYVTNEPTARLRYGVENTQPLEYIACLATGENVVWKEPQKLSFGEVKSGLTVDVKLIPGENRFRFIARQADGNWASGNDFVCHYFPDKKSFEDYLAKAFPDTELNAEQLSQVMEKYGLNFDAVKSN